VGFDRPLPAAPGRGPSRGVAAELTDFRRLWLPPCGLCRTKRARPPTPSAVAVRISLARRPGNRIGWIFSAVGLLTMTAGLAAADTKYADASPRSRPGLLVANWILSWIWPRRSPRPHPPTGHGRTRSSSSPSAATAPRRWSWSGAGSTASSRRGSGGRSSCGSAVRTHTTPARGRSSATCSAAGGASSPTLGVPASQIRASFWEAAPWGPAASADPPPA
jgi:hypothetical protein